MAASAPDSEIFAWAAKNACWILTHDLDFGAILAAGGQNSPSVIQARVEDVSPERLGPDIVALLKEFETVLRKGALLSLDERKVRVRLLPFKPEDPTDR